jgi:hypothetical protein
MRDKVIAEEFAHNSAGLDRVAHMVGLQQNVVQIQKTRIPCSFSFKGTQRGRAKIASLQGIDKRVFINVYRASDVYDHGGHSGTFVHWE